MIVLMNLMNILKKNFKVFLNIDTVNNKGT